MRSIWALAAAFGVLCVSAAAANSQQKRAAQGTRPVSFSRDVRPILADKCFKCHGPDNTARKANLRLDLQDGAFGTLSSGRPFVPAHPEQSRAYIRIVEKNTAVKMPPPDSGKSLTPAQVGLIEQWIRQGARWEQHWAFIPPKLSPLPTVRLKGWASNPIDLFILAKLETAGLKPTPPASRETLIRRVTLDLTGLPPTLREIDDFLVDRSPDAYGKVVDRLLASPRFGENWVWDWLDAARYSDTNGYQEDRYRPMWPWRDWCVNALNNNMPYDQFTVEQIAGDLLANPTESQRIATGFNRNHMLNGEGGRIPEESRVEYVMDRVDTTATVFLGLTLGCAKCHEHKYDPFPQKEYYQLYAYFNNIAETGSVDRNGSANPVLPLPSREQTAKIAGLQKDVDDLGKQVAAASKDAKPEIQKRLDSAKKTLDDANNAVTLAMVMEERKEPREAHLLIRGAYDRPGEKVTAAVPAALNSLPVGAPNNRLGLAEWLVDPANPLTARVAVNRVWQRLFGTGIVKTAEDFGVQCEPASHPDLLDWLAVRFRDGIQEFRYSGVRAGSSTQGNRPERQTAWNVKSLIKLIVTSSTYRQSSRVTPELLEKDPNDRFLARFPRYRWPSYILRDQALSLSGLLAEKLGGPPVKPYQPEGVWEDFSYGKITYQQDHGDSLYRRSLYTFWRRSVAPTTLFDTAARRVCTVRTTITNTPLQSLTLLNDTTFVEAARKLAERIMKEGGNALTSRIRYAFRLATGRSANSSEIALMVAAYNKYFQQLAMDKTVVTKMLGTGESRPDPALDQSELAAYSQICILILNLDETLSKE